MVKKETSTGEPVMAAEGEQIDVIESMTQLYTSGVDRLAEIQKKILEFAVQHNNEVVGAWKKHGLVAPGVLMLNLAKTAVERFADTQKGAIDLVVEQTHAMADLVKERKIKATDNIEGAKTSAKDALGHSIAAQRTALDYSAKQAKAAFETAKNQLGYAGTPAATVADTMQRGFEVVVDAQKELLDVLEETVVH